jgi:hypothetical protein
MTFVDMPWQTHTCSNHGLPVTLSEMRQSVRIDLRAPDYKHEALVTETDHPNTCQALPISTAELN